MNNSLNLAFITALIGAGVSFTNANGENEVIRFDGKYLSAVVSHCAGDDTSVWPVVYTDRVVAARAAWAVLQESADWQASADHGRNVQSYCDCNHITHHSLSDAELTAPSGVVSWAKA